MEIEEVGVYIGKFEDNAWSWVDIQKYPISPESTLLYRKCTGLESFGKVKNIYTETYADSETVRADFPTTITREATTITLNLVVRRLPTATEGEREMLNIINLVSFTTPTVFWDSVRQKMAIMTLIDAVEVNEDKYKGMKYIDVELKFINLMGYCPYIHDTFANGHLPAVEAVAQPLITRILS